jgi:hypothetical protein
MRSEQSLRDSVVGETVGLNQHLGFALVYHFDDGGGHISGRGEI